MEVRETTKTGETRMRAHSLVGKRRYILKLSARDKEALHEVKQTIENWPLDQSLSLKHLCRKAGLNEYKLKKGFKKLFAETPYDYYVSIKMSEAKRLLLSPDTSVNTVAYQVGYNHSSNFCIQFRKRFGITPGGWKGKQLVPD